MYQNVRKMLHIIHKGGSREVSHVQSLISRLAGREEKMAQQLLSAFERKQGLGMDKEGWQEIRDSGALFCKG
jgi:hypothetical protein